MERQDTQKKRAVIKKKADHIEIHLPNETFSDIAQHELHNLMSILSSPMFFPSKKAKFNYNKTNNTKKNIAIFVRFLPYYSGGRYYSYLLAEYLAQDFNVTIVTNAEPPFKDDFKDWGNQPKIEIDENYGSTLSENKFDLIIGVPFKPVSFAYKYAKKWNLPLALLVFETPNFILKYRGGADSSKQNWLPLKKFYNDCDSIIACSKLSMKYAEEYFDSRANFHFLYPCINELVANKAYDKEAKKEGIVFCSRAARFKSPLAPIRELLKRGYNGPYHLIGKIWTFDRKELNKLKEKYPEAEIINYGIVNDYMKFMIINKSELLVVPSFFEGFGIPPLEALWMGTPAIAYELEVLKEVYNDKINYSPLGNVKKLATNILSILERNKKQKRVKDISNFKQWDKKIPKIFPTLKKQKLSVGMIAFDDPDYVEYSLKSIYNIADEIIIVEGKVKKYPGNCSDGEETRKKIVRFIKENDEENKIKYITKRGKSCWDNKIEMQNEIAKRVTGDIYFKVDTDEIWAEEDILKVLKKFEEDKDLTVACIPFYHFWTNFHTIAVDNGGKWSTKVPRFWRWQDGFHHTKSFNYFVDKYNRPIWKGYCKMITIEDVHCYHFGYVKPLRIMDTKWKYYGTRGIEKYSNPKNVYREWKDLSDTTQPNQRKDSWAREVKLKLPLVLKDHPFRNVDDVRNDNLRKKG